MHLSPCTLEQEEKGFTTTHRRTWRRDSTEPFHYPTAPFTLFSPHPDVTILHMKNTCEPPCPFFSYRLSHSHHTLPQALFSSLAPLCILCVLFFCPCLSPGQPWSMFCPPALPVEPRPFPLARSTPLFPTSSLSAHFWTLSQILLQTPRYPTPLPCLHGEDRTDWERVVVDPRDFSQSFFFPVG